MEVDESNVSGLDMMSSNGKRSKRASSFFGDDGKRVDGERDVVAQTVVDQIFQQISNESVSKLIQQTMLCGAESKLDTSSKQKANQIDKGKNNKNQQKPKLKRKATDMADAADERDQILGSRYVHANTKKDIFKLPRKLTKGQKKKRKADGDETAGLILGNIDREPVKKKRKLTQVEAMKRRFQSIERRERMNRTRAVEEEWPMNEHNPKHIKIINDPNEVETESNVERKESKKTETKTENDKADDVEMTEVDLLDAAPVPVLDTKFDDVYDPFKD
eukprot:CAMPEP_0197037452 /NCGR_PEP_ID=MMETSP1384-20130603/14667_1 /TAXON_ID=29189 /ORGANISM="Ammonia sp." /LENGTH=275 /DNA_ID=CAMNT_0042467763 /DNA_START=1 /DNA_END=828 /DNA_ORIENTATION=-